jgi:hypothetical protein
MRIVYLSPLPVPNPISGIRPAALLSPLNKQPNVTFVLFFQIVLREDWMMIGKRKGYAARERFARAIMAAKRA